MAASSSSYSSSSLRGSEYDVFLSFRGEDTRKTFVGHLYSALDQKGFRTFKDDERLERGKSISSDLVNNINESRIAVIVFSKNYASSSWCLDELVEILECRRTKGQIVLPIFYHVKASRVRYQKRSFAEAFRQHEENYEEDMNRVKRWRDALKEAANLSGLDLQDAANGYEDKFIKNIVQAVLEKLQPKPFRVAKYEVGIDARVDKIITLLDQDQHFVGICGIGGAGKTTVAKAVFNRKSKDFEGSCFLEKVRQESAKDGGLAKLQTKLLRQTLRDQTITISDPDRGINEIKDRLGNKRLLLVLDDVDDQNILQYLVEQEWYCSSSRIILTTRDKQLLEKLDVRTYNLELLNDSEALQLFSCHAFKREKPEDDYEELSNRAKDYAKGLPLALQVLGSLLHKRGKQYWSSILDKWKTSPPKEIKENVYRVLKISYEGLNEEEKDIFLDIACFFNGCHKEYVMNIYKWAEADVVIGIQILNERSFINISEKNVVLMHDLIQEMGREIVRQESKEPGERSRLWSYDDIRHVFAENMVTEKIEAIMLPENGLSLEGGLHARADMFTKMRKLRILKINGVRLDGCLTNLSNELRYIEWDGYPQEYLPCNFHPKRHIQLHLPNSLIKGICTNSKLLEKLKVLNLSFCQYLVNPNFPEFPFLEELYLQGCDSLVEVEFEDGKILDKLRIIYLRSCENLKKTPNVSGLPCLETLYLLGCTSLAEVHPSIEFHERLGSLDFHMCENLKSLTTTINLKSLKRIDFAWCSKLENFPEMEGDMECIEDIRLDGTAIKELPSSVVEHLKQLRSLSMSGCKMLNSLPYNIGEMECLEHLFLEGTAIKDLPPSVVHLKRLNCLNLNDCKMFESLPSNISEMESLQELDLEGTVITNLPPSIVHLSRLYRLDVIDCKMLEKLPSNIGEVKSLQYLYLSETAIKDLPPSIEQLEGLVQLALRDCKMLGSLPSNIGRMKSLRELLLNGTAIKDLPPSVEQLKCLDKLDLTNCKMLGSLPSNIGGMTSLNELFLNGTVIKDLPPSVEQLKGLYKLDLTDCKMLGSLPSNIGEMKSLKELYLGGSGIKKLPSSISLADLGELDWSNCNLDEESILNLPQSLQDLNLSGNNFVNLPASFTQLTRLYSLKLDDCLSLQTLESLPSSIHSVFAKDCVSLERYSIPNGARIFELNFVETHKLVDNHGNKKPNVYYSENPLQEIGGSILLPGNEIPSWFSRIKYESESGAEDMTRVCLRMDPNFLRYLKGVSICAIFGIDQEPSVNHDVIDLTINGRYGGMRYISDRIYSIRSEHIMLFHIACDPIKREYWKRNGDGCYIEASISRDVLNDCSKERPLKVKTWGIHPVIDAHKQR